MGASFAGNFVNIRALLAVRRGIVAAMLITLLGVTRSIHAAPITYTGTSGVLSASATFDTLGTDLVVTLTNDSTADVLTQPNILASLFFEVPGPLLGLTPGTGSATLGIGSSVLFGTTDPGNVVGGEWAYAENIGGSSPNGARYGISSAGYGIFGAANFPGSNLQGPAAVNGIQYGITSAGDNPATGQPAVTGSNALIKNSVVFRIPGLPLNFDPSTKISNVFFQYGTALTPTDPGIPGVPEPATIGLLALGMTGLHRRRR